MRTIFTAARLTRCDHSVEMKEVGEERATASVRPPVLMENMRFEFKVNSSLGQLSVFQILVNNLDCCTQLDAVIV